jgi:hypothetical protein
MNTLGTFPSEPNIFRKRVRKVISEVKRNEEKWREVKGIRSEEEMEYLQKKGLKCDK